MRKARGFTLIELAIVLVILTVIAGGLLVPLTKRIEMQRYEDTRKLLEQARETLIGYALSHQVTVDHDADPMTPTVTRSHLPCPDADNPGIPGFNDGIEDRDANGRCLDSEGNLPWATLGIASVDAWGNRLYYDVRIGNSLTDTNSFTNTSTGISNASNGDMRICASAANCTGANQLAVNIPAVIISRGPNGKGALSANGTLIAWAPATTSGDENENLNNDGTYVSRTITPPESALGEFDDPVVWLSTPTLLARICPAGGCS